MTLDTESFEPLFYQLARKIKEDINSKVYGVGELLPSEREFCEEYQISRATVRQAFQELSTQGLITKKQGKGTFVAEATIPQTTVYFFGDTMLLAQGLKQQGIKVDIRLLGKRLLNKNKISEIIGHDNGDGKYFELSRIIYGNNEPWVYDLLYLPEVFWDKDFEERILCDIIAENWGNQVDVDAVIEPIIVGKKIADYLQVPEDSAAMQVLHKGGFIFFEILSFKSF